MKISSDFKYWMDKRIKDMGQEMINSVLPSWRDMYELYHQLVPNNDMHDAMLRVGKWLEPTFDQTFRGVEIEYEFHAREMIKPKFDIYFVKMTFGNERDKTHLLLPHVIEPIVMGDPLHDVLHDAVKLAHAWSSLHFVVDHIMSRVDTDAYGLSAIFPFMREVVAQANYYREQSLSDRISFYNQCGSRTKTEREKLDETMAAILGPSRNVSMVTPYVSRIGLSGTKLFAQYRLLKQAMPETIPAPPVSYITPTINSSFADKRLNKEFRDLANVSKRPRRVDDEEDFS